MTNISPTKIDVAPLHTDRINIADCQEPIDGVNSLPRSETFLIKESGHQESVKPVKLNGRSYMKIAFGTTALIALSILAYFTTESYFKQRAIAKNVVELKDRITRDIKNFNSKSGGDGSNADSFTALKRCYGNQLTETTLNLTDLLYSSELEKDLQKVFQDIDKLIEDKKPKYRFNAEPRFTYNNLKLGLNKYEVKLDLC